MGLAASQATLLQITARIHDVEFEAQQIQYAKLRLATQEDEVQQKYLDALDAQTLTMAVGTNGQRIAATFDNLCGLGSLNVDMGSNNHYIFYDENNNLLVPHDVYNGYLNYGGSDPYEFALYMMMGEENYNGTIDENGNHTGVYAETLNDIHENTSNSRLTELKQSIYNNIDKICLKLNAYDENTDDEEKQRQKNQLWNQLTVDSSLVALYSLYGSKDVVSEKNIPDDVKALLKELQKQFEEYEFCLYKTNNGAKQIYESVTGQNNFDMDKFNYYVRWGQLIEREGGIHQYEVEVDGQKETRKDLYGCLDASVYKNLENNPELLNELIMYGKLSIDVVYDNGKSGISSTRTSTTTDSVLNFQNKSTVDSTAVKKAEAEYQSQLKKINKIDKRYDMTLNKLETEREALTKEYDSVKKVAEDNIERTFGIFS